MILPELNDVAAALALIGCHDEEVAEYYGFPPVPAPVIEGAASCRSIDETTGAVCTRGAHLHGDLVHRCEEPDFVIQWKEPVRLLRP